MNTPKHPTALRLPAQHRLAAERAQRCGLGARGTPRSRFSAKRLTADQPMQRAEPDALALRCQRCPAPLQASVNFTRAFAHATQRTVRFVHHLFASTLQNLIAMKPSACSFFKFASFAPVAVVASAVLFTSTTWAQRVQVPPLATDVATLRSELTVNQVVVIEKGKEVLRPAAEVKPGDLLQYTATYVNGGTSPVKQLVASLPIPVGTQWVDANAVPRPAMASTDGKVFTAVPLMRRVKKADGRVVDEAVPLAEYRAMRWPEQLVAAGATYTVSSRVRVTELGAIDVMALKSVTPVGSTTTTVSTASAFSNNTTAVR